LNELLVWSLTEYKRIVTFFKKHLVDRMVGLRFGVEEAAVMSDFEIGEIHDI